MRQIPETGLRHVHDEVAKDARTVGMRSYQDG